MNVSVSTRVPEAALAAARNAKVEATYQVSNYSASGVVVGDVEQLLDKALGGISRDGSISTMTVRYTWQMGLRSGLGTVVYDAAARFPMATPHLAERTIENLITREIAKEISLLATTA